MAEHILTFEDGLIKGVHCEAMGLVGRATIKRASTIEFDNELQEWVACIKPEFQYKQPAKFAAKTREECVEWEIDYLNHRPTKEKL